MQAERIRLLQQMPVFGGVGRATLELLLERAGVVHKAEGEFFFHEGDRGSSTFVLEEGTVSILKGWRGAFERIRALSVGDCFGEMALLDLGPRSASVLALSPCVALEISAADLRAVLQQDVSQYALITLNMARELSRRLRDADSHLFHAKMEIGVETHGYAFLL